MGAWSKLALGKMNIWCKWVSKEMSIWGKYIFGGLGTGGNGHWC